MKKMFDRVIELIGRMLRFETDDEILDDTDMQDCGRVMGYIKPSKTFPKEHNRAS